MLRIFSFLIFWGFFAVGIQSIVGLKTKLLNVVFRHGDRTPLGYGDELFPTDPYLHQTFPPHGQGQLTNQGKKRVYNLGLHIRQEYNDFLGDIYHPKMVRALSSDRDRSKMSLQLAMAGIFSPSPQQQWNPILLWQPVIVNYISEPDVLVLSIERPRFRSEFEKILKVPEIQEEISEFSELKKNLTSWTGKSVVSMTAIAGIYNYLNALSSMELELPEWARGIFPDGQLLKATTLNFRLYSCTERLRALNGGVMLKNFSDTMSAVISGSEPDLKMNIVGGHDHNIAALLDIFDVYEPHVPRYSSAIFVELLEDDDHKYYVKVYYYKGIPEDRVPVDIPGCSGLCPFDKFTEAFGNIFPSEDDLKYIKSESEGLEISIDNARTKFWKILYGR